jgi:hypothetical protein
VRGWEDGRTGAKESRAGRHREVPAGTHEPQLISYGFFIDEEASRMTVIAIHPDAASLELHMETGGPRFPPVRQGSVARPER